MSFSHRRSSIFTLPAIFEDKVMRPSLVDPTDLPMHRRPSVVAKEKGGRLIPSRYVFVLVGFSSLVIMTTQRQNLSMAMVAMVNQTALQMGVDGEYRTLDCPAGIVHHTNETVEDVHQGKGYLLWDSEMQNHITSASFFGYVLSQTPGGRMAETLGGKKVLMFGLIIASLCNLLSPLASDWGPYSLMAVQFVKGLGQGLFQPALGCLISKWIPKPEKSFLGSMVFSGYAAGGIIGGLSIGMLINSDFFGGWPLAFYVFGLAGLVLAFIMYKFTFSCPEDDDRITESEYKFIISNLDTKDTEVTYKTPWKRIGTSVPIWALWIGMFGQYWMTFYFVSVTPTYLGTVLHFSHLECGYLNSLPFIGQMIITWIASSLSDLVVNKGYATINTVRKMCNALSCLGYAGGILGMAFAGCDRTLNIICLVIAVTSVGFGFPGSNIVPLDMTSNFAGTLMGISSALASTSGFIIPLIVGALTSKEQSLAQWKIVFYLSSSIAFFSALIFHVFGDARIQDWDNPNPDANLSGADNEAFDEKPEDICDSNPQTTVENPDMFHIVKL